MRGVRCLIGGHADGHPQGIRQGARAQTELLALVEFVGLMSLGGLAASTITTFISGVRHKLKFMGKDDFQHSFLQNADLKSSLAIKHP